MSFENAPAPFNIFNEDASLIACVKYDFKHKLENMCETKVATMEMTDCIIFDAMAVIQMLPVPSKTVNLTFVDMAEHYIDYIIQNSHIYASISQIHIVFDRYD